MCIRDRLNTVGKYEVNDNIKQQIQDLFVGGCLNDIQTQKTIHDVFEANHYLCDTHTGVALGVLKQYQEQSNDNTVTVVAATASPVSYTHLPYYAPYAEES